MSLQYFQLLSICLIFLGCNPPANSLKNTFCANELKLIEPDSGVISLKLNLFQKPDSLKHFIISQCEPDTCTERLQFGLILSNGLNLKLHLGRKCNNIPYCGPREEVSVLVNQNGLILFDGEWAPLQDLDSLVESKYEHKGYGSRGFRGIKVKWDTRTPIKEVEETLFSIVQGFLRIQNQIALKEFKKELCKLNNAELQKVALNFQSKLYIIEGFKEVPMGEVIAPLGLPIPSTEGDEPE